MCSEEKKIYLKVFLRQFWQLVFAKTDIERDYKKRKLIVWLVTVQIHIYTNIVLIDSCTISV